LAAATRLKGDDMQTTRMNAEAVVPPLGSYSHAVRVETQEVVWLYVSGQLPLDKDGNVVGEGDLGAQTQQVFENLRAVLEANDASFDDVVKIQTFFTTLDDLAGSRAVRGRYLPAEPPSSTSVKVAGLVVPEALIEVDVVAALQGRRAAASHGDPHS
jgi:reactive intermediate/imine deaminase